MLDLVNTTRDTVANIFFIDPANLFIIQQRLAKYYSYGLGIHSACNYEHNSVTTG